LPVATSSFYISGRFIGIDTYCLVLKLLPFILKTQRIKSAEIFFSKATALFKKDLNILSGYLRALKICGHQYFTPWIMFK
jgi:hypothetical protein